MNNITIAGQLGKDAEVRYMPDGTGVASFSVADSQGQSRPTIWWRCSLFGKRAESLAPYLTKGQAVTVSGTVTEREYQKDGAAVKAMEIRVQDVALQGGKREVVSNSPLVQQAEPRRQAAAKAASGFDDMDDDIPF
jgi:single-strand DNA-binding protein